MVVFGPQPPLRPKKARPAVKRASRINDETMEWLVAGARVIGFIFPAAAFAQLVAFVWTLDWHWLVSCALFGLVGAGCAAWGFWWQGNVEWAPALYDGARFGELHCNVPVRASDGHHEGAHQDGLRDPEGAQTWW